MKCDVGVHCTECCTSTSQICSHVNWLTSYRDDAIHARSLCCVYSSIFHRFMRSFIQVLDSFLSLNVNRYHLLTWYPQRWRSFIENEHTHHALCACVLLTPLSSYIEFVRWITVNQRNIYPNKINNFIIRHFLRADLKEFHFDNRMQPQKKNAAQVLILLHCHWHTLFESFVSFRLQCYRNK